MEPIDFRLLLTLALLPSYISSSFLHQPSAIICTTPPKLNAIFLILFMICLYIFHPLAEQHSCVAAPAGGSARLVVKIVQVVHVGIGLHLERVQPGSLHSSDGGGSGWPAPSTSRSAGRTAAMSCDSREPGRDVSLHNRGGSAVYFDISQRSLRQNYIQK